MKENVFCFWKIWQWQPWDFFFIMCMYVCTMFISVGPLGSCEARLPNKGFLTEGGQQQHWSYMCTGGRLFFSLLPPPLPNFRKVYFSYLTTAAKRSVFLFLFSFLPPPPPPCTCMTTLLPSWGLQGFQGKYMPELGQNWVWNMTKICQFLRPYNNRGEIMHFIAFFV